MFKMSCLPPTFVPGFHDPEELEKLSYRKLGNTDMVVSALSFGASSIGGVFKTTDDTESIKVVENVIRSGINLIDTSPWYGQGRSEEVLGKALKNIPRKAFYIATKVGRYEKNVEDMFDFSKERVVRSVKESLARLQLEYVDIIQVHDFEYATSLKQIIHHTLPALVELKNAGLARYIGITSYSVDLLMQLVELSPPGSIDTILTYCRATLIDKTLLDKPLQFFKEKNIGIINASPVAMGLLSVRGPPDWHPATQIIKKSCSDAEKYCRERNVDISELSVIWTVHQDVPTTLISTRSRENLEKNINWSKARLTKEHQTIVEELEEKFFKFLPSRNWENIEVNQYWEEMKKIGAKQIED